MAKLISVTDAVYNELSKAKGKKLSFSQILLKMFNVYKNSSDINKFAGILKDKNVASWLNEVEYGRKKGFKRHTTSFE
ncbi:MAG: antitoxin VapB family protein [Candidatus Marsarchaeota archaeon]|nr:antitoxin VapB family protein [Candidatus Marsarchaeota archaeon]MCL5105880.1 antitoxin VapB family protein [Candidatus Marsarchaeota archaeon]